MLTLSELYLHAFNIEMFGLERGVGFRATHGRAVAHVQGSYVPEATIYFTSALILLRRNWPQQLRLEEPTPKGRQDDRRETDHGGIDSRPALPITSDLKRP